jgi:BIM1-like copper acquisition factor
MNDGRWWLGGLLSALLFLPASAHAHTRLTSPASRSVAVDLQTSPCGGVARTATSASLPAGQTVQVSFLEQQMHGTFAIYFSPANDANFTLLMGGIASLGSGMTHDVMVQLPSTPCSACTLQVVQQNGGSPYYSCADIQLVGASSTTTTTTPSGSTTTSTTIGPSDPCANLEGYDAADCQFGGALTSPLCKQETVDPAVHDAVIAALTKAQSLVKLAAAKTKPAQARRLLKKADRRLAKVTAKAARAVQLRKISGACQDGIAQLIDELRSTIAELLTDA